MNSETGQRRLEIAWSSPRPSLHFTIDQGSIGWSCKAWAVSSSHPEHALRGWLNPDPAHRRHNNVALALGVANATWARDEVMVTQCVLHAPWGAHANFAVLKEAAGEVFSNFDHRSELFTSYYSAIAFQLHSGKLPTAFGSDEHMQWTWQCCEESWIFKTTGSKTKTGRWFQVFDRNSKALVWWKVYEMILCYIGLHQGWLDHCDDIDDVTLISTVAKVAEASGSGDAQAAAAEAARAGPC